MTNGYEQAREIIDELVGLERFVVVEMPSQDKRVRLYGVPANQVHDHWPLTRRGRGLEGRALTRPQKVGGCLGACRRRPLFEWRDKYRDLTDESLAGFEQS